MFFIVIHARLFDWLPIFKEREEIGGWRKQLQNQIDLQNIEKLKLMRDLGEARTKNIEYEASLNTTKIDF